MTKDTSPSASSPESKSGPAPRPAPKPALELTLELSRANEAGDEYAFRFERQSYNIRWADGTYTDASFPWEESLVADLAALNRSRPDAAARQRVGEAMSAFLRDAGWSPQLNAIEAATKGGRAVRLTVRAAAAELYALPWELCTLPSAGEHLGELADCLVRYEWPGAETATPEPNPPPEGGRILVAYSAAGGAVPAEEHIKAITRACAEGERPFDSASDVVGGASLAKIREALAQPGRPVAVLHLLCHGGAIESETESYGLVLNGDEPDDEPVTHGADALRRLLKPHLRSLRLVVISACFGGSAGAPGSALGGVAQAVHRIGVPAVAASRYPFSVPGSVVFVERLYSSMLVGLQSVEGAFLAARRELVAQERPDWASLQLYGREAYGWDTRPVVFRPYRGLLAFELGHARYFFGRRAEVTETIEDLGQLMGAGRGEAGERRSRFLVVAAASGTGKSSMVFAGALPELIKKYDFTWAKMRPEREPMAALDAVLERRASATRPFLLVVDQFEEVFTHVDEPEARTKFVRRLWELAAGETGVSVIVTMRVDYLARCKEIMLDEARGLRLEGVAYDEAHRVFVRQMERAALREVIEEPAALVGVGFEAGLVNKALDDAGHEPGALPLVEYAMDQLWQTRRRKGGREVITWDDYNALGGVAGALSKKADAILNDFDEARRTAAQRLLVQLVDMREEAGLDTRRRVRRGELRAGPGVEEAVLSEVLDRLTAERLVVSSKNEGDEAAEPAVEIAHEQLVRSWETLRAWLNEARERVLEMAPLAQWVKAAQGSKGYVLTGDQLARARALREKYEAFLDDNERGLIERSEAAVLAAKRTRRALLALAGAVTVIVAVLAVVAWLKSVAATRAEGEAIEAKVNAEERAAEARRASQMASARELFTLGKYSLEAMVLGAVKEPKDARGWRQLATELLAQGAPISALVHEGAVRAVAWSPDGKRIVTASWDKTARVWNADGSGTPVVFRDHEDLVNFAAWSPDGQRIVTVSRDKTARVWNADGSGKPVVFRDHKREITSAAWSPDGEHIVTVSNDETARVWSADGGCTPVIFKDHEDEISSAAWSPDGRRVVTASKDKTARVWSADGTGAPVVFKDHKGEVLSAAWSPDGRRIVTASTDNTARVWNADGSGAPVVFKDHAYVVNSAMWSPDGKRIVTASVDKTARVWYADGSGKPVVFRDHGILVNFAAWSPDGQRIVSVSVDKTARVWNADGSGAPMVFKGHESSVDSAAWSPDGRRIVTGSLDNTAWVWSAENASATQVFKADDTPFESAAWSPDGERVVAACYDNTARVWSAGGSGAPLVFKGHNDVLYAVAWSPDGERFVTASGDKTARVWNADGSGAPVALTGHEDAVLSAAWSPDGKRIVTASKDKTARVWNADGTGAPAVFKDHDGEVNSAQWSPDGARIVTASKDKTARVWNADGSGAAVIFRDHEGEVNSAAWSPDGKRIVTASEDKTARVWNADGSGAPVVFTDHQGPVMRAAWSGDGERIATASGDRTARVWRADGSGIAVIFKGHEDDISSIAWSPDGKRILSASSDKTVRVWNADGSGTEFVFKDHSGMVRSAAWSPDGGRVVSAGLDDTTRVWHFPEVPELQRALRSATTDCLTIEQRQTYLGESEDEARDASEACERSHGRIR